MRSEGLSTGEAARLCSVKPDTVLKWIKSGRLAATRTAGGHYRIDKGDLAVLIPPRAACDVLGPETPAGGHSPLRCWEYLSRPGAIRDECRRCVVYQIRSAWCFRVATDLGCDIGQKKSFCASPCEDCPYYRRVSGLTTNVLVITSDTEFVDALGAGDGTLTLRFARNAYEASAVIAAFRAAFVVVDDDLIADGQHDLIDHLIADTRLPGVRIVLGVSGGGGARPRVPLHDGVVSVVEKPFGQDRIVEVVGQFPVEPAPPTDAA
ncbi:MAG: excisionase family DNA-binding protein [Acidobacteria bacterium]|nr:excisionase family DNA-binding protein [Acidobacteriota bacterium]